MYTFEHPQCELALVLEVQQTFGIVVRKNADMGILEDCWRNIYSDVDMAQFVLAAERNNHHRHHHHREYSRHAAGDSVRFGDVLIELFPQLSSILNGFMEEASTSEQDNDRMIAYASNPKRNIKGIAIKYAAHILDSSRNPKEYKGCGDDSALETQSMKHIHNTGILFPPESLPSNYYQSIGSLTTSAVKILSRYVCVLDSQVLDADKRLHSYLLSL